MRAGRSFVAVALAAGLAVVCGACASQTSTVQSPGWSAQSAPVPTTAGPTTTANCAAPELPSTVPYKTVAGIDPNLVSLDIHTQPGLCDAPVVMWVHGGGYRTGDKANQIADKVALANSRGWILVSVNYRLTDEGAAGSARFPDHFQDVADSVAWVHAHIGSYGGDPDRFALMGHSAGADIVANVVTNPAYLNTAGLDLGTVSCAGPLDTEGFDKTAAGAGDPDGERDQWRLALGNNPDYLTATSATNLIRPGIGIPPMIGVVRGTPRRQDIEATFLRSLRAAGIPATTIDATTLSHNEVNSRIGRPGDTVMTEPIVTFLSDCFAQPPP